MPNVTLTELTDDVYRALGDSGHTASVRNPTIPVGDTVAARDATVHKAINDAIKDHVVKAESLGYFPINDTGTIAVVSGTREYDLDANLQDASSNPNFRSDLVIFRTDTTNPVAMLWPQRGDYRAREFLKNLFSDPRVDIPPITHPVRNSLYLRDSFVGFVSTPTTTMTLTCYYSPMIERLSTGGIENLRICRCRFCRRLETCFRIMRR